MQRKCFRRLGRVVALVVKLTLILSGMAIVFVTNNVETQGSLKGDSDNEMLAILKVDQDSLLSQNAGSKRSSNPLEMLKEYQQHHSESVLYSEHQNGGIHNRTFVIGLYACPNAAGNRLHEFFNSIILAIAHNYTITWKFHDAETCRALGNGRPDLWCNNEINTLDNCGAVVERASWIPSYDEWGRRLNLTFGHRDQVKGFHSRIDTVDYRNKTFHFLNNNQVWVPVSRLIALPLFYQQRQIMHRVAATRLKELYSMGIYYLYGMLFHEIFPFLDSVKPSPDVVGGKDEISIALHSRHVRGDIDGSDVSKEKQCIQDIIHQHEVIGTNLEKCKIYLLSDRNATLEQLRIWIPQNTKCSPVVATHDVEEKGLFDEHGPFALKGFFHDLALAAHANGGYIGSGPMAMCSSADLVRELYEYNHYVLRGNDGTFRSPLHCEIPKHD